MKFKTVAKHYIGCKVFDNFNDEYLTLTGYNLHGYMDGLAEDEPMQIKPILRKLEDMDIIDAVTLCLLTYSGSNVKGIEVMCIDDKGIDYIDQTKWYGDGVSELNEFFIRWNELPLCHFHFLSSKSYDLFGLIDSSEALDAKTVNNKKGGDGE